MGKKVTSECMFCGEQPCVCNRPAEAKRPAEKTLQPVLASKPVEQKRAGISSISVPKKHEPPEAKSLSSSEDFTEEELLYRSAVRALSSILSYEDIKGLSSILNTKPSKKERFFAWRVMHKEEKRRRNDAK